MTIRVSWNDGWGNRIYSCKACGARINKCDHCKEKIKRDAEIFCIEQDSGLEIHFCSMECIVKCLPIDESVQVMACLRDVKGVKVPAHLTPEGIQEREERCKAKEYAKFKAELNRPMTAKEKKIAKEYG